jgi:multidrug resistance protein
MSGSRSSLDSETTHHMPIQNATAASSASPSKELDDFKDITDQSVTLEKSGLDNEDGAPTNNLNEEKKGAATEAGKEEPYTAFSLAKRLEILFLTSLSCFVSPMTANIILPALPSLAEQLPTSLENANLTVTVYMIFQAITPIFLGSLTDLVGRRPIYLLCFVLYEGANVGLANLPNSYTGFLLLRILQASGAASLVSIGAGSLADITVVKDRGTWMGIFQAGSTVGPALGSLLGAVFDQVWGWRSIFWFCFIVGGVCFLLVLFLLPE